MLTPEDQPLTGASDKEIDSFLGSDRCVVIDWRSSEEETMDEVARFLPADSLKYDAAFPDGDSISMHLQFHGREDNVSLPLDSMNNLRVLLRAWHLLKPDYDMCLFRRTEDSDTYCFLLRPMDWWNAFKSAYPAQFSKVFRDLSELAHVSGLDAPEKSSRGKKPWWKFW